MAISWRLLDRRRLLVTALCLVAWRALDQVPIAGLNQDFMSARLHAPDTGGLFHAIGGSTVPFASYSLGSIGIRSYIYALMLVSLLPFISGRVDAMQKTVEGRMSLGRWTRALGVLLSMGQAYSFIVLIQNTRAVTWFVPLDWFTQLVICLEMASGTVVALLLADLIDEFGLGFGNAAFLLFVLGPVGLQVHRLADYAASPWPPLGTFLKAGLLWAVVSVALVVATVAFVRAARVVRPPKVEKSEDQSPTELKLLLSGVLRPPAFAAAIMSLPPLYAGYLVTSQPEAARWINEFLTPFGPNVWNYPVYLAVTSCLIVAFAVVVVNMDHSRSEIPKFLRSHMTRVAFIGGCFLALTVEVVPFLELRITSAARDAIPLSGFEVVLVVVVILATLTAAQGRPATRRVVANPLP